MKIDYQILSEDLTTQFESYHDLLISPINGIHWENLLYNALLKQSDDIIWNPGSHQVGTDITYNGIGISCKGGRIRGKKRPIFNISSHRTTSYTTLQEKIEYLSLNHEDAFFCLSYKDDLPSHHYTLYTFDSDVLDYKSLEWQSTKGGWKGKGPTFEAKIQSSMSDQLWLLVPLSVLNERVVIEIPK
tara:strand:- start:207 stop:767 length:561 start_codon:yes stop_codon:yes gene_type:complete